MDGALGAFGLVAGWGVLGASLLGGVVWYLRDRLHGGDGGDDAAAGAPPPAGPVAGWVPPAGDDRDGHRDDLWSELGDDGFSASDLLD